MVQCAPWMTSAQLEDATPAELAELERALDRLEQALGALEERSGAAPEEDDDAKEAAPESEAAKRKRRRPEMTTRARSARKNTGGDHGDEHS
jgi:hypothetical protein